MYMLTLHTQIPPSRHMLEYIHNFLVTTRGLEGGLHGELQGHKVDGHWCTCLAEEILTQQVHVLEVTVTQVHHKSTCYIVHLHLGETTRWLHVREERR